MRVKDVRAVCVGQWVRTKWNDAGCLDCLVIGKEKHGKRVSFKGFFPASNIVDTFEENQVTEIGWFLSCKENGL